MARSPAAPAAWPGGKTGEQLRDHQRSGEHARGGGAGRQDNTFAKHIYDLRNPASIRRLYQGDYGRGVIAGIGDQTRGARGSSRKQSSLSGTPSPSVSALNGSVRVRPPRHSTIRRRRCRCWTRDNHSGPARDRPHRSRWYPRSTDRSQADTRAASAACPRPGRRSARCC